MIESKLITAPKNKDAAAIKVALNNIQELVLPKDKVIELGDIMNVTMASYNDEVSFWIEEHHLCDIKKELDYLRSRGYLLADNLMLISFNSYKKVNKTHTSTINDVMSFMLGADNTSNTKDIAVMMSAILADIKPNEVSRSKLNEEGVLELVNEVLSRSSQTASWVLKDFFLDVLKERYRVQLGRETIV